MWIICDMKHKITIVTETNIKEVKEQLMLLKGDKLILGFKIEKV